jgi:hypothetical protein
MNDAPQATTLRMHLDTLSVPAIQAYLQTMPPVARTAIRLHVQDAISPQYGKRKT